MAHEAAAFGGRIVSNPEVLVGKPAIKGTRISVELVLGYLAHTPNFEEFFLDYPDLTMEDVQACFAYAQTAVRRQARLARRRRSERARGIRATV